MDANLRIIKSIQKMNEALTKAKKEREEIKKKQEALENLKEVFNKQIEDIKDSQGQYLKEQNNIEKELTNKIENIKLIPGEKGDPGKDGKDGKNGKDGRDGKDGKDGKNGIDGKDGKDGSNGLNGRDGSDGVGVLNATVNDRGDLIIKLTNNKIINAGHVKGQNGAGINGHDGTSVKNAEVKNGHLIITLDNGKVIDAGVVSGGGSGGEEVDPIFTSSPAYEITSQDISNWNNKSDFSGSYNDLEDKPELFSGDYNDLDNKPTIPVVPTNVSAFTNDAGYLTEHQSLSGYATETWVENQGYLTNHQDISGKYDKTGGEITGNVKIDGNLTLDIEDEDYDSGITFTKELNTNLGTVLTLTGYADNTTYRPIIRNVGTPQNNYDVANKKYVDDNIVRPLSYFVFLNADGTIDMYSSQLDYSTVKSNLTNLTTTVYLDVIQGQSRFYVSAIQDMDVNNGPIKFIGIYNKDGNKCLIEFNLYSDNTLTVEITLLESLWNKTQDVSNNSTNTVLYPSVKAVYDFVMDFVKPHVVWESSTPSEYLRGISANLTASPAWQLTNLDLTPYKRIKIYSKTGQGTGTTANASTTASMILEMTLDERSAIAEIGGHYVASALSQKPNDNNRLATLTCAVSSDKTSFVVLRQTNLYGTGATQNNDVNANVFLIEGYYY